MSSIVRPLTSKYDKAAAATFAVTFAVTCKQPTELRRGS